MDICSLFCVLIIVFYSICFAIICLADSDILTFLCSYLGKAPVDYYNGKVVWITGASSGIGEGIAKELSKCPGAKIVISARRKDELERVKKECLEANAKLKSDSVLVLPLDMTDYASHKPSFEKVLNEFGKLDVLISNAGRSQRANWQDIEPEVDKSLFELNVFSLINLNRIVVRHFLEVGRGQLAIMSSVCGKIGAPNSASYNGSKFAIHGFFEGLRNETREKNLPITMICPGPVFSNVLKEAFTSKNNEKVNQEHLPTDKRMTAERCGFLCLVGMANQLEEIWLAPFPIVPILYCAAYQPYLFTKLFGFINSGGRAAKLRDNREIITTQET